MRKLLRANFARLWKDKVFWCGLVVLAGYGILGCLSQYSAVLEGYDGSSYYELVFFNDYILNSVVFAAFTNLFLGCEYSDGTIRNKLVTGASRTVIYCSSYVTCAGAGILMQLFYSAVVSALGIPLFGWNPESLGSILVYSGLGILLICSETAVFTLVSMLCQNKAAAAVLCQIGAFAMLFAALYLMSRLSQPEMLEVVKKSTDGSVVIETVRNTGYLSGRTRSLYQFGMDFLPAGQGFSIAGQGAEHPALLAVYSLIVIVVCNVGGIFGFKRKDLK